MPWERSLRSRSASAASAVVTTPPSPVAMVFTGWNEKHAIRRMPRRADIRGAERMARVLDQQHAAASSATAARPAMSQTWPSRCTGSTARGAHACAWRVPSAAESVSGVIRPVSGSTSANTTSAPVIRTALAVARKVIDGTITASPGRGRAPARPGAAPRCRCCRPPHAAAPVARAKAASNRSTVGPVVRKSTRSAAATAAMSSSSMVWRP